MKILTSGFLCFCIWLSSNAQINTAENSVEVIGYWLKKEKLNYQFTNGSYKIKGKDTTFNQTYHFNVEISVADSAEKFYIIEWKYSDFQSNITDPVKQKIASIKNGLTIKVSTSDAGSYLGIANWSTIKDEMKMKLKALKEEFKGNADAKALLEETEQNFSNKDAMQYVAFAEISQYYSFFGEKFNIGKAIDGKAKIRNRFGGEPLDAEVKIKLDEVDTEDQLSVLNLTHVVNPGQAKNAIIEANLTIGDEKAKTSNPGNVQMSEKVISRFHSPTGWILFNSAIFEVVSDKAKNADVTTFKLR